MLVIIPARGGSKGLPRKNILPFCGKPLIAHTIEVALKSKNVSRVIVSTDCSEIAETALKAGAEVPFMRPNELASDTAAALDVYLYTMDKLNTDSKVKFTKFCVLQATSPLRTTQDVESAIELFSSKNAHSVISVCKMHPPPEWAKKITSHGSIENYYNEPFAHDQVNRQNLKEAYAPNGAIYVFNYETLKSTKKYYSESNTFAHVMPKDRSIDIDDLIDFKLAEFLLRERISGYDQNP